MPNYHVIMEVPGIYGNTAGFASRLRTEGIACKKIGETVVINGLHIPDGLQ